MFSCESYFHNQKKRKRFEQRRLRIIDDSYSIYGDRGTITYRGKQDTDTESKSTAGVAPRPIYTRRPPTAIRPGSSRGKQVVIAPTGIILPPVNPLGPKLISTADKLATSDIRHTEEKLEFLKDIEKKQAPSEGRRNDWSISEAKFASSSILSRLSKHLYKVSEDFEVTLAIDLVEELNQKHEHLIKNTVVAKRNWQTDCYQEFQTKNKLPFLTSAPEDQTAGDNANAAVDKLVHEQQKEREKHVRLKQKPAVRKMSSPERPMTAMSNYSIKSEASQPSEDGRESRNDYDLLPPELRPTILHYRRESSTPKLKMVRTSTASTRLERMKKLRDVTAPKHRKKKTKFQEERNIEEEVIEEEKTIEDTLGKSGKPLEFRLSAPTEEDWIVIPSDAEDPEANTLRMWDKQLKELMRSRQEEKLLAKQRGEDGPLFVKFYNDPQMRTLRTKGHQRAATFPMPSFFSKLPPSIASFSTPTPNDALLIGEGLTAFVLTLPDSSGYCKYNSERVAISMSRHSISKKGLYTLVFEDKEGSPLIAYFTPSGSGGCYHPNGGLRMLYNKEGGSLFDEDGCAIRKWCWPTDGLAMPVTVNLQINANMSLRCTSLTSITLRFSCRGQSHKFTISSVDTLEETDPTMEGTLQSNMFFISKFAMNHNKRQSLFSDSTAPPKQKRILKRSTLRSASSPPPEETTDTEKPARELSVYRERIRTVVDNWMDHYRECIGISLPKRLLSGSKRYMDSDNMASRDTSSPLGFAGRQVKTSMGFYPGESSRPSSRQGKHTRSYTHPFPSPSTSRSPSPLQQQYGLPLLRDQTSSAIRIGSATGRHSVSPPVNASRIHLTPYEKSRVSSELLKPFRTGISKPRPKIVKRHTGCPVGLRHKILKNMDSTPPCKCDKRHIPYIFDLEYDSFLCSQVPKSQLIVVCVVSSIVENSCPCEPMLNAIYCAQNRHRFSPCNQCSSDEYRLLKYDICQATKEEGVTCALLIERHNATPGTFLMYVGGKLVYANHTFNGYGTAKKDFMKQVQRSIEDGKIGNHLPDDFKLSHCNGSKIQSRNAWAYPVSGVMQELVPFTPESGSSSNSKHSETGVADPKLPKPKKTLTVDSFAEMSYGRDHLQFSVNNSEFNSRSQSRVSLDNSIADSVFLHS